MKKLIPDALVDEAQQAREKLLDALSLFSEAMTEQLLEGEEVPQELMSANHSSSNFKLGTHEECCWVRHSKTRVCKTCYYAIALYLPSPIDREVVKTAESVSIYPKER